MVCALQRDGQIAGTDQIGDGLVAGVLAVAGEPAHAEPAGALRDQQANRPRALQLQRQHPVEFDRAGEQQRSRDRFAEHIAYRLRVLAVFDQCTPGGVQMNQVTPDRIVLEHEPVQTISIMHFNCPRA